MDPLSKHTLSGIERLELELIVRDFVSVLNAGCFSEFAAFLHDDVVYRPSGHQVLRGRTAVVQMCRNVVDAFEVACVEMTNVAVDGDVVLAEEWTRLKLRGKPEHWVMGFSSYRFEGFQISEWRRMHA
jgi:limonene-1,2-epoxide hydrolase